MKHEEIHDRRQKEHQELENKEVEVEAEDEGDEDEEKRRLTMGELTYRAETTGETTITTGSMLANKPYTNGDQGVKEQEAVKTAKTNSLPA